MCNGKSGKLCLKLGSENQLNSIIIFRTKKLNLADTSNVVLDIYCKLAYQFVLLESELKFFWMCVFTIFNELPLNTLTVSKFKKC